MTDVERYSEEHSEQVTLLENGKLRFDTTGMEFPSTASRSLLDSYAQGRAMRRAASKDYDFDAHKPFLVPHKDRSENHFLYCTLTEKTVPRIQHKVEQHTSGKRYQRLLAEELRRREVQREQAERAKEAKRKKTSASNGDVSKSEKSIKEIDKNRDENRDDYSDDNEAIDATLAALVSDDEDDERDDNCMDEQDDDSENVHIITKTEKYMDIEEVSNQQLTAMKPSDEDLPQSGEDKKPKINASPKHSNRRKRQLKVKNVPSISNASDAEAPVIDSVRKRSPGKASVPRKVLRTRQRRKVSLSKA